MYLPTAHCMHVSLLCLVMPMLTPTAQPHKVMLCTVQECKSNENTVLAVTPRGGHVAFLQGLWPLGTAWMDQVAIQFLTTCSNMCQNQFDATQGNAVCS